MEVTQAETLAFTKEQFEASDRAPLPIIWENLPVELKYLDQWVCWYFGKRDGKRTKIPLQPSWVPKPGTISPNGRPTWKCVLTRASSSNPDTWTNYDMAKLLTEISRKPIGIGFMLSAADPYTMIDLDDARDPATGAIAAWARPILSAFGNTYTEVSPSGTGLKILLKGKKPGPRCRRGTIDHIEIYDTVRFTALTGHRLDGTPREISNCQEQLTALYHQLFPNEPDQDQPRLISPPPGGLTPNNLSDQDIIRRACESSLNFASLWNGDTSKYPSASEADFALASSLAFWCGPDPARIQSLMEASGLRNRRKWSRRDYLPRTIQRALSSRTDFYGQGFTDSEFANCEGLKILWPPVLGNGRNGQKVGTDGAAAVESLPFDPFPTTLGNVADIAAARQEDADRAALIERMAQANYRARLVTVHCQQAKFLFISKPGHSFGLDMWCASWSCPGCRAEHQQQWRENVSARLKIAVNQGEKLYAATISRPQAGDALRQRLSRAGAHHFYVWEGDPDTYFMVINRKIEGFEPITLNDAISKLHRLINTCPWEIRHIFASPAWKVPMVEKDKTPKGYDVIGTAEKSKITDGIISEVSEACNVRVEQKGVPGHLRPWVYRLHKFAHPKMWGAADQHFFFDQLRDGIPRGPLTSRGEEEESAHHSRKLPESLDDEGGEVLHEF